MGYYWLLLVLFAQLLNAVVVLIDKYLVTEKIPHSVVYAFFVGVMSSVVVLFIPTGQIFVPSATVVILSFLSGFTYIQAIVYLYKALRRTHDASDVIPVVGASTAISTFVFSYFILSELLPGSFLIASVLVPELELWNQADDHVQQSDRWSRGHPHSLCHQAFERIARECACWASVCIPPHFLALSWQKVRSLHVQQDPGSCGDT